MTIPEPKTLYLVGSVLALLAIATGVGQLLKRRLDTGLNPAVIGQFHLRIRAWWLMCSVLAIAFVVGPVMAIILFGGISFWALREFITLTPTRRSDHRALFWVFFCITPLQYVAVGLDWHGFYSIFIPVCAFLFIMSRVAWAGDFKRFLERTAKIHVGLMISVYCLSYAPALLTHDELKSEGKEPVVVAAATANGANARLIVRQQGVDDESTAPSDDPTQDTAAGTASPAQASPESKPPSPVPSQVPTTDSPRSSLTLPQRARLLFFFVLVVQIGDITAYVWGKLLGKTVIAPEINPEKTWEGFAGGVLSATAMGTMLYWATPFTFWEAAGLSLAVSVIGFAGGMTMSAIKRDRGVKDYGTLVAGHGGVLDRIDSICFAAPVFFYLARVILW